MGRPIFLVLAAVGCLLLTACVVNSNHPLSSPDTAQPDPGLVGMWGEKDDATTYVITIKNAHWMHYREQRGTAVTSSSDFFITRLDDRTYMNLRSVDEKAPGYAILRYEVVTGRGVLMTWGMDEDKTAAAVRAERLQGTIHTTDNQAGKMHYTDTDVTLRGNSETLARFIHDEGVDALFSDKHGELYRIH